MYILLSQAKDHLEQEVTLKGWLYNKRSSGKILFLQFRDGYGFIQAVASVNDIGQDLFDEASKITLESSIEITGKLVKDERSEMGLELQLKDIKVIHMSPDDYPIGKKEHGPDFLFDNRHLYFRSKSPWAILRIRDQVTRSIENYLHEENFIRTDAPIIQPTSCEDTTQLFEVNYYDTPAYLSQSGQLYIEATIGGFGRTYTFTPAFRAEKSKTRFHLSELWMMDAEAAFVEQDQNMDVQEGMVKRIVKDMLDNCGKELKILERDTSILEKLVNEPFERMKHKEVKKFLEGKGMTVDYKDDMTTEEEIKLGEIFKKPVFICDYPFETKSFYMKSYTDSDGMKRAVCADLIAPEEGREIIGGSQREDSYDVLLNEIVTRNYPLEDYQWYLDTRKYGSVPHSGFGIGLERSLRWLTGAHHVRETIAFPRTLTRMRP